MRVVHTSLARVARIAALAIVWISLGHWTPPLQAQNPPFDLLIKNGHVIDARNGVDAVMDVAIAAGKIAQVAANIPIDRARTVADATGLYVTPGLIDIHAHVFWGHDAESQYSDGYSAVQPDSYSFRSGQTTLVDVGGAGWRSFPRFKEQVIDRSRTRVLSFLNIVGSGMRGGPVEQNLSDMDANLTAIRARQHKDLVVGIKVAHYSGPEWDPVTRAVQAGREAEIPVMVDFGGHTPPLSLEDLLLKHLRPGDIFTHTYAHVGGRTPIVDEQGRLRPYVLQARKRGIIFDAGHGGGSFLFRQAVPATKQGFYPDVIRTGPAHRQHEQRHEGHPQRDVEASQFRDADEGCHQGEHGQSRRGHQADGSRAPRRRRRSGYRRAARGAGEVRIHRQRRQQDAGRSQARMRADGEGRTSHVGFERDVAPDVGHGAPAEVDPRRACARPSGGRGQGDQRPRLRSRASARTRAASIRTVHGNTWQSTPGC